jgi:hypothetical protein
MTQSYEPVEISEDTPEPEEYGVFLIVIPNTYHSGEKMQYAVFHKHGDFGLDWLIDGLHYNWGALTKQFTGTIQSLAAHDAQIRAEAWDEGFTEGRDLAVSGQPMTRNNPYREQKQ